jgi:MFS family permease
MADDRPPRALLLQRNYSSLFSGQLISISGERLTYIALVGLLADYTTHFQGAARSSFLLWLLGLAMLLPVLLFAPFTGAWVDRMNLKRVMISSDSLRALLVILIPVSYLATHQIGFVYLLVFALFTCNVFFLPAKSAITPEIVPPSQLLLANTLLAQAGVAGTGAGLIGSWIVDHLGWSQALYINGATYVVSVMALVLIVYRPAVHHAERAAITVRTYLHEVTEGWRMVRVNRRLWVPLTALGAIWVGGGFLNVAGNQHIQHAAGAVMVGERVGALMAALAVGSALATWWVNTHGRAYPRHVVLAAGLALAAVGLVAFAVSTRFAVFAGAGFIVGIGAAPAFVLPETMLQEGTELRQRGRVFSARDFLMRVMFLGGQTVAGIGVPFIGTSATLLVAASFMALVGVIAFVLGQRDGAYSPA